MRHEEINMWSERYCMTRMYARERSKSPEAPGIIVHTETLSFMCSMSVGGILVYCPVRRSLNALRRGCAADASKQAQREYT